MREVGSLGGRLNITGVASCATGRAFSLVHCATVPPPPSAGKIPCPQSPQLGPYSINQTRRPRTSQVIYILLFDWTGLLGVFSAACTCTPSCCLGLLGKLKGRPSILHLREGFSILVCNRFLSSMLVHASRKMIFRCSFLVLRRT